MQLNVHSKLTHKAQSITIEDDISQYIFYFS